MKSKLTCCGLGALVCAAVSATAFSATVEDFAVSQESSFAAVSMAGVSAAEKAVPVSSKPSSAFFMNEEACSALDRIFIMQPTRKDAVNMFRPCVEAISKTHGVSLKMWDTPDGITIFHTERPEAKLLKTLASELAKRRNQVFGYPVSLVSSAREMDEKPFMGQKACSALDRRFIMQPSRDSAMDMLRPCVAAIGKAYDLPIMVWDERASLTVYVGRNNGTDDGKFSKMLASELAKRDGQFFGYSAKVILGWPSR